MTTATAAGYIVARAHKGSDEPRWEARDGWDHKPTAEVMRQYRQAWRGYRVRVFTEEQFDALPYGAQSADWRMDGYAEVSRHKDGVRR